MNKFKNISVEEAKELLRADNYLIDIRDKESFSISHVDGALNLSDENIDDFIKNSKKIGLPLFIAIKASQVKSLHTIYQHRGLKMHTVLTVDLKTGKNNL